MAHLLKGALIGVIALGGLAMASTETSAMPIGNLAPVVSSDAGHGLVVQNVYWRRWGWGWRRPGWRYGYGWHRPWGFYRPWGYYHRWGWRYGWRRPWGWRRW